MKISATGKETTVIEFSKEELAACRLTYENISRDVIKSRTAIYTIITETAKLSGNEKIIDESTEIDILPDGEGGCVIILSNARKKKAEKSSAVFSAESADVFLDLAKHICREGITLSRFYGTDDGYVLYAEGEEKALERFHEFADGFFCESNYRSRLDEYGTLLIEADALEILCGRASEK
ncbi:MAG: adaptor protein MecA [Clostridia bacterium]|nr:adaptor protein MecA [Clostridia bacterium]